MDNNTAYNDTVCTVTGVDPYSGGGRRVIAVYLDRDRADRYYIDISIDEYGVDG